MSESAAATSLDVEEYLRERVNKQQRYLSNISSFYQKRFYLFKMITIVLAVTIPFLASQDFCYKDVMVGLAGLFIAITEGILGLYKYQDNWLQLRATSEALKHERVLFQTRSNHYKKKDDEEVFHLFVDRIESILMEERERWKSKMTEEK